MHIFWMRTKMKAWKKWGSQWQTGSMDVEKGSMFVLGWADAAELGMITSLSFILPCKAIDNFEFMLT